MSDDSDLELRDSIADALLVLANVGFGDLDGRVEIKGNGDAPLAALFAGINEMIESLRVERERNRAYQTEIEDKLATIEQQRAAIRELSTPVIEIWDGILCLPVVGIVDSVRSAQMTDVLLQAIAERRAQFAIVDITGIEVMDTKTVDHFVRLAKSVRLIGADCVLTGISPNIANTMVAMGVSLGDVTTHRSLREALKFFVLRKKPR
ncbi:MAG: STAS domain-containing protein [Deltaproteobacteria bacterium]|nr:STAS domain-containing protein [Deltaproteobacteria bacterium]